MSSNNGRMRVGLALGGGVARGLAHVGVLSVLEEAGVPLGWIAGSPLGGIIRPARCGRASPSIVSPEPVWEPLSALPIAPG